MQHDDDPCIRQLREVVARMRQEIRPPDAPLIPKVPTLNALPTTRNPKPFGKDS